MRCLLFQNEKCLKNFLARDGAVPPGAKYLPLEDLSPETIRFLEGNGIPKLCLLQFDGNRRDQLVAAYIDLVGQLGVELNSLLWWATDLSSKNRFNSNLPEYLQQFLTLLDAAKNEPCDCLLVLPVAWPIHASLKAALTQRGLTWTVYDDKKERWCSCARAVGYRVMYIGRHFWRSLWRWTYTRRKLRKVIQNGLRADKGYYVVKTFVYDHSFVAGDQYRDAFFGPLPDYLKGRKELVFFANILGDFRFCVARIAQCRDAVIIPMDFFSTMGNIVGTHLRALCYWPRSRGSVMFAGEDVTDIVNNEMFLTSGRIQTYQLLHYRQLYELLKRIKVETFLTSFENNPWEKMCFLALRRFSPMTKIIGYQHTVTPQASVNMFISRLEADVIPKPDRILTVGEGPQRIIQRYTGIKTLPVEPACALRFEYLFSLKERERQRTGVILLALEGIFEAYKMVNYVMTQLQGSSRYRVILRTHPVLPLSCFEHKLKFKLKGLSNFTLSRARTLQEDIEKADIAIYWGSTVGMEALWVGKPVIHYNMGAMFSYDPLYECHDLKWVVKDQDPLPPVIEAIYALPDNEFKLQQRKARIYLEQYFYPITEAGFKKFL